MVRGPARCTPGVVVPARDPVGGGEGRREGGREGGRGRKGEGGREQEAGLQGELAAGANNAFGSHLSPTQPLRPLGLLCSQQKYRLLPCH